MVTSMSPRRFERGASLALVQVDLTSSQLVLDLRRRLKHVELANRLAELEAPFCMWVEDSLARPCSRLPASGAGR